MRKEAKFAGFCFSLFLVAINSYALPRYINPQNEKVILFDGREHQWGAYDESGRLVRSGLASGGADYCKDIHRPCHTRPGMFRVVALGDSSCYSTRFPIPKGGAPMPYCMYFNGNQALHGSPHVVRGNISHGCVRMHPSDAKWLRYNFAEGPNYANGYQGTMVVVRPY